jgi:hypothetical protein
MIKNKFVKFFNFFVTGPVDPFYFFLQFFNMFRIYKIAGSDLIPIFDFLNYKLTITFRRLIFKIFWNRVDMMVKVLEAFDENIIDLLPKL